MPSLLQRRVALPVLAFAATLASCASGPYGAKLTVEGGANLNKTFDGKPTSVNIRIVQMVDRKPFDDADLEALYADDLKDQPWVVAIQDESVRVGLSDELPLEIKEKVRFVGVIVLFNEIDGTWRQVLDCSELSKCKLFFDDYALSKQPIE